MPEGPLDRIGDRLSICDVLAAYCEAIDRHDVAAAGKAFTEDCETDFGAGAGGLVHGRDKFIKRVKESQARFRLTHHQLGQIRVHFPSSGAETVAHVAAIHVLQDGSRLDLYMQYHDLWVSAAPGWRITARRVLSAVRDGDRPRSEDDWYWVPRMKEGAGGVV